MRVLVTGGSGKIGGYALRELLAYGCTVSNYSRTPPPVGGATHIQGDITDLSRMREAFRGHDAVVHLAAVPGPRIESPERLMYVDVRGTFNVLEAAVQEGVRKVVFGSSNAAMNNNFAARDTRVRYFPIDEEHPSEPRNEYGISKLVNEITCKRYSEVYGIQTICLRLNNNWYLDREGAEIAVRSGWNRTRTVEDQWTSYRGNVEDPSKGLPLLWAVTDARDAAQAIRLSLENDNILHDLFIVDGGDVSSLLETSTLVSRYYPDVPSKIALEGHASLVSHDKAERLLGFTPRYTWRESDFAHWWRNHMTR